MKRIIALLLSLVLLLGNLPLAYAAADDVDEAAEVQMQNELADEPEAESVVTPEIPEEEPVAEIPEIPAEEIPAAPEANAPAASEEETPAEEQPDTDIPADAEVLPIHPEWENSPEIAEITTYTADSDVLNADSPYIEAFEIIEAGSALTIGDTVHFRAKFSDSDGIRSASLWFGIGTDSTDCVALVEGTEENVGWMVGEFALPENAAEGTYLVWSASVTDNLGLTTAYRPQTEAVAQRLFPGSIVLSSAAPSEDEAKTEDSTETDSVLQISSDAAMAAAPTYTEPNEYLLMKVGQTHLASLFDFSYRTDNPQIRWYVADTNHEELTSNAPVKVDQNGNITALKPGTALVCMDIIDPDGYVFKTQFCVVEVVAADTGIKDVTTGATSAVTELYKNMYTRLYINLVRGSSQAKMGNVYPQYDIEDYGVTVTSARFTDSTVANLFTLAVVDDQSLEIVPTDYAMNNPSAVKSSYKTGIMVTADGKDFVVHNDKGAPVTLTLSVKKTVPKISIKALKFNSVLNTPYAPLQISDNFGYVYALNPDNAAAAKAKKPAIPNGFDISVEDGYVFLNSNAPKVGSGKLYLLASVAGWNIQVPVTVSYSIAATPPKVTFTPKSLNLNMGCGDFGIAAATITPIEFSNIDDYPIKFVGITDSSKRTYGNDQVLHVEIFQNQIYVAPMISDGSSHTYTVYVSVAGKEFGLKVNVKPMAASLTAKKIGSIDTGIPYSYMDIQMTPKNYAPGNGNDWLYYHAKVEKCNTKTGYTEDVSNRFYNLDKQDYSLIRFTLDLGQTLEPGYTYNACISATSPSGYELPMIKVPLNIKRTDPNKIKVTASVKVVGKLDVSKYESCLEIIPTVKNCGTDYIGEGKVQIFEDNVDITKRFDIFPNPSGKSYFAVLKAGEALNSKANNTVMFSAPYISASGSVATVNSPRVKLPVTISKVKFSVSSMSASGVFQLNSKNRFDQVDCAFTYPSGAPFVDRITMDGASAKVFDFVFLNGYDDNYGRFVLKYKNNVIDPTLKPGSTRTVKFQVFLVGNKSTTPNGTVTMKVNISK